MASAQRKGFQSISEGGLVWSSLPLRLFRKGNRLFWDPEAIDLSREAADWDAFTEDERDLALRLATLFIAGEEAVTEDIMPFVRAMGAEGRLGDEMYLTQFAFEEAKHIETFRLWLDAIGETADLHPKVELNPAYKQIFYEILPESLAALDGDHSPRAQVRAATVYNQVVEGVLALTGYYSWRRTTTERDVLPGMQQMIRLIARDERRHMAWGTFTCRRHIAADPSLWDVVQDTINSLMQPAMDLISVTYEEYEEAGKEVPFGTTQEELTGYAMTQFSRRLEVIEAAKSRSVAEVEGSTEEDEEELEEELAAVE